jgi:hypothetical protein
MQWAREARGWIQRSIKVRISWRPVTSFLGADHSYLIFSIKGFVITISLMLSLCAQDALG